HIGQEPPLQQSRVGEEDREGEAGAAAEEEPDETLQCRVARVLRHDPRPALTAGALAQKVPEDLVQVRQLVGGNREQRLAALPHHPDRRQESQRPAAPPPSDQANRYRYRGAFRTSRSTCSN